MKKQFLYGILFLMFLACNPHNEESDYILNQADITALNKKLASEPKVEELQEILQNLTERIVMGLINKDFTSDELKYAYLERNFDKVQSFMNLTDLELKRISIRLNEISSYLMNKYPLLSEYISTKKSDCTDCSIEKFFGNYENILSTHAAQLNTKNLEGAVTKSGEVDCRYLLYTAALVLCAKSGPILYIPCAYIALCSFCSGGWVDKACEN